MTIQNIISKAIKRLEVEGKLLTPDFYAEAFCKEATIANMNVEDCSHLEKYTSTLNKEFQKELQQYRIKTMSELTRFLVARLNRTNQSVCSETLEAQMLFTKRVLQVVSELHNKEASDLAAKSLVLLDSNPNIAQIEQFRQLWTNFITSYDNSFLQKIGIKDKKDLKKSIESIEMTCLESDPNLIESESMHNVASLLVSSLVPSIASSVNEKIANLSHKIRRKPELLSSAAVENEIKEAIKLRIALDKESVKEMVESLDGVLDKLSIRLIEMIERSDKSTTEIEGIKKELEKYNEESENSKVNFKLAHKKLYTLALALEESTKNLSTDLNSHNNEVKRLSKKIEKLENQLNEARAESKEDFLTKLYNKRALDEFIAVKEAEYERYNRNYSIVMLDIDHFKSVNDNYGHDAGDAVLYAFAKIAKQEARTVDIIGRFGGEEFMALLSETDAKGALIFAEKVRKHVQKAKFMYRGNRIEVTVSAGIGERKQHPSLESTIKCADENLYKAKKNGRNQVIYK
ncbi:diguanylate cyclase [Sulfurimonas lithotrophica]|uniref:diguanylate cyclase n=1 Tax=Sulfurimonas lithotrophica TaxID=2590022 RepID=A0A5P8P273_9BACT|nr:GGDEF domain-containing protein [Sulfurimonas lithotrophica]QFR49775.1 diguanylate cyclase [Sulfurimonas lithotrophica]